MKRASVLAALFLAAAPMPSLGHGAPNWKAVAWERNQDTPDGLRWSTLVDVNSITRAGDLVGYRDAWEFIDDKKGPIENRGGWHPKPEDEITGTLRVRNCKTGEYLHGSALRGADGKIQVKPLTTWSAVPAGPFRVVQDFVCSQR